MKCNDNIIIIFVGFIVLHSMKALEIIGEIACLYRITSKGET